MTTVVLTLAGLVAFLSLMGTAPDLIRSIGDVYRARADALIIERDVWDSATAEAAIREAARRAAEFDTPDEVIERAALTVIEDVHAGVPLGVPAAPEAD